MRLYPIFHAPEPERQRIVGWRLFHRAPKIRTFQFQVYQANKSKYFLSAMSR